MLYLHEIKLFLGNSYCLQRRRCFSDFHSTDNFRNVKSTRREGEKEEGKGTDSIMIFGVKKDSDLI